MLPFPRDRNCYIVKKGPTLPVSISAGMMAQGWPGGQGVQWADSTTNEFLVDPSDGVHGGFFFWGSSEPADQYLAVTGNQPHYGFGVISIGSWVITTSTYERYTYASRQSGPLVPVSYEPMDRLYFSLRGYWTKEDEWTLSSDPRAPNGYSTGMVIHPPSVANTFYLTIQTTV